MALPKNVAIIMDGNGRWAQLKGRPRAFGHIKGTRVAKKIITSCARQGIKNLTLYAFSSENWLRPKAEVSTLMNLLKRYLHREVSNLVKENIKFSVIGDMSKLPKDVFSVVQGTIKNTQHCTGMNLIFALSYGSRQEIISASKAIAQQVSNGDISVEDIDEQLFSTRLSSFPTPDPDLVIRTSGEQRISNFLLWQIAYSEFFFVDTLWPDFTEENLNEAFKVYSNRTRRFGKTDQQLQAEQHSSAENKSNEFNIK